MIGLIPLPLHRVVESDRAKHVAMIGHGTGCHTEFFDPFRERFNLYCAVEKAVVGVEMKVNEVLIRHGIAKCY